MPRAVVQPVLLSDSARFEDGLITRHNPEFLRPLAHAVSTEAPTGLLRGLIHPAGVPVARTAESDLPMAPIGPRAVPVQRLPTSGATRAPLVQAITPAAPRPLPVVPAPPAVPVQVADPGPTGSSEPGPPPTQSSDDAASDDAASAPAQPPPSQEDAPLSAPEGTSTAAPQAPGTTAPAAPDLDASTGPQGAPVQRMPSLPDGALDLPGVPDEDGAQRPLLGDQAFSPASVRDTPGDGAGVATNAGHTPAARTPEPAAPQGADRAGNRLGSAAAGGVGDTAAA
ncbi:MAG TPA: hypothetical protein VES02_04120, partial [Dermatophilaceae bacterium]|nr:hypothetical protein [Dermatophilaceae bacterium]